jgi:hypothetical protein
MISASKLGKGESPELNIASSLEGVLRINLVILLYPRAALSMVKAILLEVYLIGAHFVGPSLARYWTSIYELGLGNWILAKGQFNQGVIYILNLGKGLPKDSVKGVVIWNFGIAYSPRRPWQRKDHSTMFIYHLSFQR